VAVVVLELPGSPHQYEAGFVRPLDGLIHAIQQRLVHGVALCGAGRIDTRLVGRFDPDSTEACPNCVRDLSSEAEWDRSASGMG